MYEGQKKSHPFQQGWKKKNSQLAYGQYNYSTRLLLWTGTALKCYQGMQSKVGLPCVMAFLDEACTKYATIYKNILYLDLVMPVAVCFTIAIKHSL